MTFIHETASPIGEITKQHRKDTENKDNIAFRNWCKENGFKAGNGKVLNAYVSQMRMSQKAEGEQK